MLQLIAAGALLLLPASAFAHHAAAAAAPQWNSQPWLVALLAASAVLYALGVRNLWRKAGRGRGIRAAHVARFALGWIALAAALLSPLDAAAAESFALHMIQHELLMVVAAPLMVLARPLEAWTWALPPGMRRALAAFARAPGVARLWRRLTEPVGAWCVHAVALWVWHLPAFFDAALAHESVHIAQHTCFLASALIFWWSALARRTRPAEAAAMASLFTTMLHTSVLGALLTFAPSAWYGGYAAAGDTALTPLEDQQLGGLIMWVPAGMAYIAAGLAIVSDWLRDTPRAARLR